MHLNVTFVFTLLLGGVGAGEALFLSPPCYWWSNFWSKLYPWNVKNNITKDWQCTGIDCIIGTFLWKMFRWNFGSKFCAGKPFFFWSGHHIYFEEFHRVHCVCQAPLLFYVLFVKVFKCWAYNKNSKCREKDRAREREALRERVRKKDEGRVLIYFITTERGRGDTVRITCNEERCVFFFFIVNVAKR